MRSLRWSLLVLCGAALMQPMRLTADEPVPVKGFPSEVGVVIRIADPTATVKKFSDMAAGIDPVASATVNVMGAGVGALVDNPAKQGIKPATDWWVGVVPQKQGPPIMIYAVQPSDEALLKETVGDRYQYVKYDNWTLYTRDEATSKMISECITGSGKSIEGTATDETKTLFMDSDVAVFVNLAQLKITYKDEIEMAREQAHQALEEAELNVPEVEGMNMSAIIGMYGQMFEAMLAAFEDSNSLTAVFNVDNAGLKERVYLEVKPGSQTDKVLQVHKPAPISILANLPADQLGYFGLHGDMQALTKWSMSLLTTMFELDEEGKKSLAELETEMEKFETGSYVMSFGMGDRDNGYLNAAVISEVKNAKSMRDLYIKSMKVMSSLGPGEAAGLSQSFELKKDAEKVGDFSVDQMIVKQEINEELDPLGIQKQIINAMYGPEGAVSRIVYAPDAVIQSTGGGLAFLEKVLAAWKNPSPSSAMKQTRENLADDANLVMLFDLPGFLVSALSAVADNAGPGMLPIDATEIENLKSDPSYSGASVTSGAGALRFQSYMPVEQMRGIYQIVMFGMQTFQNMRNPQF